MPLPVTLLILATLLPLASCLLLVPLGKRFGTPLAGYVATFFISLSFLCSGWGLLRWLGGGNYHGQPFGKLVGPFNLTWRWLPIGSAALPHGLEQDHPGWLDLSIYVDSLTVALFVTITLSAMLVHIFATRSLRRDPRFARFFACLSLTCFAALAAVLSGTLLQLAIFLEMVGFAASLLAAFRSDSEPAVRGSAKMFLIHRIGDIGLLIGLGVLVRYVGNLSFPELWLMLGNSATGVSISLPGHATMPLSALTFAGVCLFFGAAARCAQFPLHVWAGDCADSIAPALAMVFSIAVSVVGILFIARIYPLLTSSARLLAAIIGATTLTMGALIAVAQPDVKKALAFLAVSQLGWMVLGVGVGSWSGAMFHLVAFAFFQTLLFLAAGAVIRAARGETHLSQYGGLFWKMPVTAVTAGAGALAACGVGWGSVGLSGFFSRGLIFRHAAAFAVLAESNHRSAAYWALFVLPVFATLLTAFALSRWWMLIFAGAPRDQRLFDHAREVSTLFWPMVVLAIMTALTGNWLGVRDMLESAVFESRQAITVQAQTGTAYRSATVHAFDAVWPIEDASDDEESSITSPSTVALIRADKLVNRWVWPAIAIGLLAGYLFYGPALQWGSRIAAIPPIGWIRTWLESRMFFDELFDALFVTLVIWLAQAVAWIDQHVIAPARPLPP